MITAKPSPGRNDETRGQFIKKTGTVAAVAAGTSLFNLPVSAREKNPSVSIVLDAADALVKQAPVRWAAEKLRDALAARGMDVRFYERLDQVPPSQECVLAAGAASNPARQILGAANISPPEAAEAMAMVRGKIGSQSVLLTTGF